MKTEKLFEAGKDFFMQTFGGACEPLMFFFKSINDNEIIVKKSIGPASTKVQVKFIEETNTIDMILSFNEYKNDSEIPVKRYKTVDYDSLKIVKFGTVIIDDSEVNVRYHFGGAEGNEDEIFCIVTEETENFAEGFRFYTHYKSLKVS